MLRYGWGFGSLSHPRVPKSQPTYSLLRVKLPPIEQRASLLRLLGSGPHVLYHIAYAWGQQTRRAQEMKCGRCERHLSRYQQMGGGRRGMKWPSGRGAQGLVVFHRKGDVKEWRGIHSCAATKKAGGLSWQGYHAQC